MPENTQENYYFTVLLKRNEIYPFATARQLNVMI